jgi:N-acyl-D-amino-acid deacylase
MVLDYLVRNARIVDPESGLDFAGNVGIRGDKIDGLYPAAGPLPQAAETIDAGGGILVPGFIDIHAHTDNDIPCAEKLLAMGVTTAVSGNCGLSPVDFESFFAEFEKTGYPINQLELAGHTSLREAAGQKDIHAAASKSQIETMKRLAQTAYAAGAAGISFGLEYVPGTPRPEALELARTAADAGRFISIHGRYRAADDLDSLREALELAVLTGAPLVYSHLVYMYRGNILQEALRIIEAYREQNANVWVDSGMYTAFASFAGAAVFAENFFQRNEFEYKKLRAASGKYAGQILDRAKFLEIRSQFPLDSVIYDPGGSDDVYAAYSLRDVMVSTDCMKYPPGQGHPQGAATYPYFFRVMVKERKQLTLMDAVKRCTLLPAQAAGLAAKGRLAPGMDADLTVLDWDRLREHADFPGSGDPGAPPEGITHVFVNGAPAIKNGKRLPGVYAGKAIRSV